MTFLSINISSSVATVCRPPEGGRVQRPQITLPPLFKASGPMLSISRNVCLSVRLFVRLSVCSLLRYRLNVFVPPLPEVECPTFLEIRNPWGKVMERSGFRFERFCLKVV